MYRVEQWVLLYIAHKTPEFSGGNSEALIPNKENAMTHDEYMTKKASADKVFAKAVEFFEDKKIDWDNHGSVIKIFPFWEQVYITDDGAITQLPRGTTEEHYQELFKQLGMTSLEFREVIRTMWELHRQRYEWWRKDPNCEEYYEDMYSDVEEDESVNS